MRRARAWASRWIPGVHPGIELLALRAEGVRHRAVDAHVRRCRKCRHEADLIAAARSRRCATEVPGDLFENLQLGIRAWCSLSGVGDAATDGAPAARAELSDAMETYFGKEAARRIRGCIRSEAPEARLAPATRPLFNSFLGRRAADALVSRIAGATSP